MTRGAFIVGVGDMLSRASPDLRRRRRIDIGDAGGSSPLLPFAGPLDAYLTGLAGAWLPFRGFASYEGPGYRVRDTVGDAEQNVGFDPATGDLMTFTVGGDAATRWWYDQSGNANDLPQPADSAQPLLVPNLLNGQPVLRFDGVDDELVGSSGAGAGPNRTIYLMARKRSTSGVNLRLFVASMGANTSTFYEASGDRWRYYATIPNVVDDAGSPATSWGLLTQCYATGAVDTFFNSTLVSSFENGGVNFSPHFTLCSDNGSLFIDADVAALLIYDLAHDAPTRSAIETILAGRIGLAL